MNATQIKAIEEADASTQSAGLCTYSRLQQERDDLQRRLSELVATSSVEVIEVLSALEVAVQDIVLLHQNNESSHLLSPSLFEKLQVAIQAQSIAKDLLDRHTGLLNRNSHVPPVSVISPAELHPGAPTEAQASSEEDARALWQYFLRRDLAALVSCDAIVLLQGWEKSRGARFEKLCADVLGLKVIYDDSAIKLEHRQIDQIDLEFMPILKTVLPPFYALEAES